MGALGTTPCPLSYCHYSGDAEHLGRHLVDDHGTTVIGRIIRAHEEQARHLHQELDRYRPLGGHITGFLEWLSDMDAPDSETRKTVSLQEIIDRARDLLGRA